MDNSSEPRYYEKLPYPFNTLNIYRIKEGNYINSKIKDLIVVLREFKVHGDIIYAELLVKYKKNYENHF